MKLNLLPTTINPKLDAKKRTPELWNKDEAVNFDFLKLDIYITLILIFRLENAVMSNFYQKAHKMFHSKKPLSYIRCGLIRPIWHPLPIN